MRTSNVKRVCATHRIQKLVPHPAQHMLPSHAHVQQRPQHPAQYLPKHRPMGRGRLCRRRIQRQTATPTLPTTTTASTSQQQQDLVRVLIVCIIGCRQVVGGIYACARGQLRRQRPQAPPRLLCHLLTLPVVSCLVLVGNSVKLVAIMATATATANAKARPKKEAPSKTPADAKAGSTKKLRLTKRIQGRIKRAKARSSTRPTGRYWCPSW